MNVVYDLVAERLPLLLFDFADEMAIRVKPAIGHGELKMSRLQITSSIGTQTGRSTTGAYSPLPQRRASKTDNADQHGDRAQERFPTGETFMSMVSVHEALDFLPSLCKKVPD